MTAHSRRGCLPTTATGVIVTGSTGRRSTRDLLNTLAAIGAAEVTFRSLHDAWADTTTPHGRLILAVLGGLADFERHLIIARTSEGRKRAKGLECSSVARAS